MKRTGDALKKRDRYRLPDRFKNYFFKGEKVVDREKFFLRYPNSLSFAVKNPIEDFGTILPYIPTVNHGVYVATSTIPNGGFGLFAGQDFEEGEIITHYHGIYLKDLEQKWLDSNLIPDAASHAMSVLHGHYTLLGNFILDNKEKTVRLVEVPPIQFDRKGGAAFANTLDEDESEVESESTDQTDDVEDYNSEDEVSLNMQFRTLFSANLVRKFVKDGQFVYDRLVEYDPEDILIVGVAIKSIKKYEEIFCNYNYKAEDLADMLTSTGTKSTKHTFTLPMINLGIEGEDPVQFEVFPFHSNSAMAQMFGTKQRPHDADVILMNGYQEIVNSHAQERTYESLIERMKELGVHEYFIVEIEHERVASLPLPLPPSTAYPLCSRMTCSAAAMAICGQCNQVQYCSMECQKQDWAHHAHHCMSKMESKFNKLTL